MIRPPGAYSFKESFCQKEADRMTVWKKARRIWGMVCLLLVLAAGLALPAAADVGPKPSVEVVFQGMEGRRYYATLLGNVPQ